MRRIARLPFASLIPTTLLGLFSIPLLAQVTPEDYSPLTYRHIGPAGNRVSSVSGVTGDPLTYYAGAASGGLFKSTDGGVHWAPIFDDQPVASIGAIAVAPSDPNVVWVGTGEPFIRSHISVGWGMFKSTDAGKTWTRKGLDLTGRIARIVIAPRDPDVVLVAAMGHAYGPQPERGIYRTTDGGDTWDQVLFVNDSTGAIDLVMDPSNPRILYAATWQLEIHTWGRTSGGAGSGIWKSTDGGTTWKRLTGSGLPKHDFGKVGLAVAPSNPDRVYALIETSDGVPYEGLEAESGELWRSENGGGTWALVSHDRQLAGRTHYYTRMMVSPDNENEAYFLAAGYSMTRDGGATTVDVPFLQNPGWDHHDMWIEPADGDRMIVGSDCCVSVSVNRGKTWIQTMLPIAQMYHVTADNSVPYYVLSNRQDGPSARGPSNSKTQGFFGPGTIFRGMWSTVGGGESGWATPDPEDPNLVWSSASGSGSGGGIVVRFNVETGARHHVEVWPEAPFGDPAEDLKYRFVWTFPLIISPHDHDKVYVGSQYVHVTTDGGRSWQVISADLTRNDKSRQVISGGLTPDNIGVEYAGTIFSIAESRLEEGLIWVGTNDGLVHLTRDGGTTWTDVTGNVPDLLEWGTIGTIEASRHDAGTAYFVVDGHQVNSRDPWVYKTSDYGQNWQLIVNGLEKTPLSYARVIREDPFRPRLLYLGTEGGLYLSFDDGENWQPFQGNMPHAPVSDMVIQEHFNDLVVSTYGRGIWIMDDLSPLQRLTPAVAEQPAHLFPPHQAYRFRPVEAFWAPLYDPVEGTNPRYGARIDYWLAEAADSAEITILNAPGDTVRTLTGTTQKGLNRVMWDLEGEDSKSAKLRTPPLHAPQIPVPEGGRDAPDIGTGSILHPPGTYTVRLTVGDQEFTQPLQVLKDPASGGSETEIASQFEVLQELFENTNQGVEMINAMEVVRAQLVSIKSILGNDDEAKTVRAAADSLNEKIVAVEGELTQLQLTGRGQDGVRYPSKLISKLFYLGGGIATSDYAPTTQQLEVAAMLKAQLAELKARYEAVMSTDLPAFNRLLTERGMTGVFISP